MLELEDLKTGPGIDVPSSIDTSGLRSATPEPIEDDQGRVYEVFLLKSNDEMPRQIAEWLRYRTLTEMGTVKHERDKDRFKNVDEIVESFLIDSGGRNLYLAVSEGRLYGIAWIRPILNDEFDFQLLEAGHRFMDQAGLLDDDHPNPRLDTIAMREYGVANRQGLVVKLGTLAVTCHFDRNPDSQGVVGIYVASDGTSHELSDEGTEIAGRHPFVLIEASSSEGWVMLMSTRKPVDRYKAFQPPTKDEPT